VRWSLVALALTAAAPGSAEVVDRVVATVDDAPVTASACAFEAEVRAQLDRMHDSSAFGRLLNERVEPLEAVMFRLILRRWAEQRDLLNPDEERTRDLLSAWNESFPRGGAEAFRRRWAVDDEVMAAFFAEHLALDAVIELSVPVRVTESKKRGYHEANRERVFGGQPYEAVESQVSERVYALEFEAAYNAWRQRLRARATKRYLAR
jgi:hypothetical protein